MRKKQHADLLPHVENMRRLNPFGRKRTSQEPANPSPVSPVPSPVAPQPSAPVKP